MRSLIQIVALQASLEAEAEVLGLDALLEQVGCGDVEDFLGCQGHDHASMLTVIMVGT